MRVILRALLIALVVLLAGCAAAPAAPATTGVDVTGDWHGRIDVPGAPLDVGLTLTADGGTFDLPAQGLTDLPLTNLRVDGDAVTVDLPDVPGGARFAGTLAADGGSMTGDYTQAGQTVPFSLERGPLPPPNRPQEPQPPLPYRAEDVTYPSGDITLAGTLTLPEGPGPFTAVVMITGSGQQDRDESLAGHRPFLVLADAMTRAGYAVLRVDDRGAGGSGGDYTAADLTTLADDALAGVTFLAGRPEIAADRIGLFGHSEGGYVAPLAAQRSPGAVAFVVSMAGPAVPGAEVLVAQNELLLQQAGATPAEVAAQVAYVRELVARLRAGDEDGARALARDRIAEATAALPAEQRPTTEQTDAQIGSTVVEARRFAIYDPAPALFALSVPVLAFFGGTDVQVPPTQSEPPMRELLAANPDATVQTLPGLNHLMQPSATGNPTEYGSIETTVDPAALDLVTGWLGERF